MSVLINVRISTEELINRFDESLQGNGDSKFTWSAMTMLSNDLLSDQSVVKGKDGLVKSLQKCSQCDTEDGWMDDVAYFCDGF